MARLTGNPSHAIDAVSGKSSLALARQLLRPSTGFGCYGIDDILETEDQRKELVRDHQQLDMNTAEADFVAEWYNLWSKGQIVITLNYPLPIMIDPISKS